MADLRPMLATTIPFDSIGRYVADDNMAVQQKVDGDRLLVSVIDGRVTPLNRKGAPYSNPIPRKVLRPFESLKGTWFFDGELLDELWLFDLPLACDAVSPRHPFEFRHGVLERVFATWQPDPSIRLLPTARTRWAKESLVERVLASRAEGVVFRHVESLYTPGPRRSLQMLKAKDVKTIDCVVTGVRVEGRNNCHVSLFEGGHLVEVGSCAMLGKPPVVVGDVVEVKYLYADTARRLVQPAFLKVRDDKSPTECTTDQLVFTNRTVIDHGGLIPLATKRRQEPGAGLGRTQVEVLHLLALRPMSVRNLEMEQIASPGGVLHRLGLRGLVDRKFEYGTLVYHLTKEGARVEHTLLGLDEDGEELAS